MTQTQTAAPGLSIRLQRSLDGTLLTRVQDYLLEVKRARLPDWQAAPAARRQFIAVVAEALVELNITPPPGLDIPGLAEQLATMMTGIGVLTPLLYEDGVEEIIVRDGHVQVEQGGVIYGLGELAPREHFEQVANRVADLGGAAFQGNRARVVVDLPPFGDRFTAIKPPLSAAGVAINIRRFARTPLTLAQLAAKEALPAYMAEWLAGVLRDNAATFLIVGASGAGKTTLLNALCRHVPHTAQLAIAETFRELSPGHPYPVRAVAPSELTPQERELGLTTLRDVVNTIYTRMRPDLLLVGEVVGAEAVEFLRAINLGNRAAATIHGGSALGGLIALETLAIQYGGLAQHVARSWIARGLDLVIHMERTAGRRFISEITVLDGLEAGEYRLQPLYVTEAARHSRAQALLQRFAEVHT